MITYSKKLVTNQEVKNVIKDRQKEIKDKGFNLIDQGISYYGEQEDPFEPRDFSKLRVGLRTVDNSLINLGTYKKVNPNYGDKRFILNAIYKHDYASLREISNYFFESSGIYYRLCKYLASIFRYDWYVTPFISDIDKEKENKVLKDLSKVLLYLDKSNIKRLCGNIALEVIKEGVYYGYIADFQTSFAIQKLPATYCRSRYYSGVDPIVELNLQFFDAYFSNPAYKLKILKTFPEEIQKAYVLFKQGKLKGDYPGDTSCWVALDPAITVKISLNDQDFPCMVGVIPSIIDLDQAQELDRQKTMQQLLKIIVQKLPLDKNGDLIFDVDEAKDIHNNAVAMLKKGIGLEVLTTFADIIKIDAKDNQSTTSVDDLEKVERTLYNNSGVTHNIFNAEGNIAVTNSILVDEAAMRDLPLLFENLLNKIVAKFSRRGHYDFRVTMLETTQFNYKEIAKLYKEHAQLGYPKLLPQIALGQSQSTILATMMFENEILHLADIMIPPMSSNTMSSKKDLGNNEQSTQNKSQNKQTSSNEKKSEEIGRPEKEDAEKSDKTIANRESEG